MVRENAAQIHASTFRLIRRTSRCICVVSRCIATRGCRAVRRPTVAGLLRSFPVVVMVADYSRFLASVIILPRVTGDLLAGIWHLHLTVSAGCFEHCCWDNEAGIGRGGRVAGGVACFSGVLGTRPS